MDITSILTSLVAVVTIIGANFGFMKFLLKDIHNEQIKFNKDMEKREREYEKINNRMDGIYRILLDKSYPKNMVIEDK